MSVKCIRLMGYSSFDFDYPIEFKGPTPLSALFLSVIVSIFDIKFTFVILLVFAPHAFYLVP